MASPTEQLLSLANPLATVDQLSASSSQLDGVPADLERSLRFAGAQLTQAAGILLRLPQEIIAQAIIIFYRFYIGTEGGSFRINAVNNISAAALYLTAKISSLPQSTRSITNVYAYLLSEGSPLRQSSQSPRKPDPESYYLSEGSYYAARAILLQTESIILRAISFVTCITLPHHLSLTYLQTLGALPPTSTPQSIALAERTLALLNTALFSPQLLYLTHQPNALAVAAIYLAAREVGVKLSNTEWWEVFDVEREELGFLVVGLGSCERWIAKEKATWQGRAYPMTIEQLDMEMREKERKAS